MEEVLVLAELLGIINRIRMDIIYHHNITNFHLLRIWQDIICMDHRMHRLYRHHLHINMQLTERLVW